VEPSPPPARLLGKSPEYAMTYTQSYRHAGKREQGSKAITGCLVGTAVGVVLYLAVLSSVANSTDTTTY